MQNFCDIKQVVELLNMQPSKTSQYELRFGKRGSLSVDLKAMSGSIMNIWWKAASSISLFITVSPTIKKARQSFV